MKFVVIKGVVFLTFWQDMVLTGLVHQGIIKQEESWSSYNPETSYTLEEVKDGLQNFIVVIEMFVAALAYAYAFPFYDYKDRPGRVPLTFGQALRAVFGVGDVLRDVVFNFGCVKREFAESEIDASVYNRVMARARAEPRAPEPHRLRSARPAAQACCAPHVFCSVLTARWLVRVLLSLFLSGGGGGARGGRERQPCA